ncbi:MAG TPA: rod-binding protein [Caulobacteraceae bacterium]|nr:rod-binding protein [Caulobacteraceae bacterium]
MNALSLPPTPVDPTQSVQATSAAELARRGQIHKTAQNFEASFLTTMFETMFSSVPTDSAFGGGPGEDMWKGFLAEAIAKETAQRGGIGVAAAVEKEMLKLQGLSEPSPASAAAATPTLAPPRTLAAPLWRLAAKPSQETVQ